MQEEIDNIESSHPGYDEYRYDLGMIGHDPHELAAFLSAVLQGYTRQSAQAELARVFAAQYQLTLTEEVEIRYRTETSTDPETGETTSEEVPYEYYILNVKLTSKPISAVASELLTPEQMEMYQVYRQTMEKLDLLAKKHPDQIIRKDAHNFTVPKRCVSVREPYSAERRKAASERAKAAGYQPPVRKSGS